MLITLHFNALLEPSLLVTCFLSHSNLPGSLLLTFAFYVPRLTADLIAGHIPPDLITRGNASSQKGFPSAGGGPSQTLLDCPLLGPCIDLTVTAIPSI